MNRKPFVTLALVAVAVVAAGCTPNKEDKPPAPKVSAAAETPAPNSAAAKTSGAPAGGGGAQHASLPKLGAAPRWQLKDLNGKTVTSDELKGKVVVVDFWATWCPPCRVEIPGYIALQEKYGKDGLAIVGVSLDQGGAEVVKPFADKNRINYTMLMADEAVVSAFGGVEAIPTTFLIDRSGQVRDRKQGMEETAEYEKKILAVLGEKA